MITRRDLIVAAVVICATAAFVALAQTAATKPILHSSVFNWSSMKADTTANGERRNVFDAPTATLDRFECHITTINPGESSHAPHKHPQEELLIVKEGTLEAVQNDTTNRVDAGGMIFEASNESHGVRNIGLTRATYFVLMWYPRDLAKATAK
jgi:quercetin dioxygenase-like cupin family protein